MADYIIIESRDPFDSTDTSFVADTADGLRKHGNKVTVFLVQNGVLAARKGVRDSSLARLAEAGITLLADDFSLKERGLQPGEWIPAVKESNMDQLVDLLVRENTKAIWH